MAISLNYREIAIVYWKIFCIFIVLKKHQKLPTMAKVQYKEYNQNDFFLFPPCIGEFVPENHPVRTVNTILYNIDISDIESTYKGGGTTSYNPRMLLKIVVYAYLTNVYSGRRMASLLEENVFFMWLSGMNKPNFRTINRFRSENLLTADSNLSFIRLLSCFMMKDL